MALNINGTTGKFELPSDSLNRNTQSYSIDLLTEGTYLDRDIHIETSVQSGDYSTSVNSHSVTTTPVVTPAISGNITDITTTSTPSGTNGTDYWTLDPSGTVTTTGVSTASSEATVGTTGFISAGNKTSSNSTVNITPTVAAGTNRYMQKATLSSSGTASATTTVAPGDVLIAKDTTTISGKTNLSLTPQTSNTLSTTYYTAVKATANANSAGTTSSITGTTSSGVSSAGYAPTSLTASGSVTGTATAKTSAKSSAVNYIPIPGVSGSIGGTASAGSADVTVSSTNSIASTTQPGGTAGTDYWAVTATPSGTAGSYTPKYTVSTAGWIPSTVTGSAQSVSVSAGTAKNVYIPASTLANTATSGTTYIDASTNAPVLQSGDYLYINAGYTPAKKISLSQLVPDDASIVGGTSDYICSGQSAYDKNGDLIAGSLPQSTLSASLNTDASYLTGHYAFDIAVSPGYILDSALNYAILVYNGATD